MLVAGTAFLGAAEAAAQGAPQGPAFDSPGASHDIVMRMSVPASCRMTAAAPQIRLSGRTDDGRTIETTLSGQGGLVVDCNTPYSMSLARSPLFAAPRHGSPRDGRHRAEAGRGAEQHATVDQNGADTGMPARDGGALAGDMDVVIRIEGRGGTLESQCVMAVGDGSPYVCHAFAGPDDARVPPPRAAASLIVTGALRGRDAAIGAGDRSLAGADDVAGSTAFGADSDEDRAASAASDDIERRVVRRARELAWQRRVGDRLTVSLSARY